MDEYRDEQRWEHEDQRYDRQTVGSLLAIGALLFAVPAILLLTVFGVISW